MNRLGSLYARFIDGEYRLRSCLDPDHMLSQYASHTESASKFFCMIDAMSLWQTPDNHQSGVLVLLRGLQDCDRERIMKNTDLNWCFEVPFFPRRMGRRRSSRSAVPLLAWCLDRMANCNDGNLGCDLQPCCCRSGFDAGYGGAVGRFSRGGVAEAMINVGR